MIEYGATLDQGGSTSNKYIRMDRDNRIPSGLSVETIDYINLMCIVKKGQAFSLTSSRPYNACIYKQSFLGNTYKLIERKRINSSFDEEFERRIASLPDGVKCTKRIQPLPEKLTADQYSKLQDQIEYMWITYSISADYSFKMYEFRNKISANTRILKELSDRFVQGVFRYKAQAENSFFMLTKDTISYPPLDTKIQFVDLNMTPFPSEFICFCFADALAQYLLEQKHSQIHFSNVAIIWRSQSSYYKLDKIWVNIRLSYSIKYDNYSELEKWV